MRHMNDYRQSVVADLVATAAGTTVNGNTMKNEFWRGLHLVIDITALGASATLTVTIEGYDPLSGKYYTILASAALAAVATTVLKVYPGLTAAANLAANDVIPSHFRVKAVTAVQAVTAKISASLIR